jgi:formate dehydrogenase major subunit
MGPRAGCADREVTMMLPNALSHSVHGAHPSGVMAGIVGRTPRFTGVSYETLDRLNSLQRPRTDATRVGTPSAAV